MKTIPVLYTPKVVADSESYSPSAAKPKQVVASWTDKFPIEIRDKTMRECVRVYCGQSSP